MCFWAAAFVLIYGVSLLAASRWPDLRTFTDTSVLVALGIACIVNFWRHRTLHCGITGPVFFLGAFAMGLIETGLWAADSTAIWGVVLIAVGAAFVIEWRTVGRDPDESAS